MTKQPDKMIFENNTEMGFSGSTDISKMVFKNCTTTSEGSSVNVNYALHGISFIDANVLAIMRGDKTETRRLGKPRWKVGDVLYVKETLTQGGYRHIETFVQPEHLTNYRSDYAPIFANGEFMIWKWKRDVLPAMFMPRKAARTFIKVLEIYEEHLWDVTDRKARAEGVANGGAFASLWGSIHSKPGFRWADNPAVWVTRFERCEP